jgi:hypothetical protein
MQRADRGQHARALEQLGGERREPTRRARRPCAGRRAGCADHAGQEREVVVDRSRVDRAPVT